MNNGKNLVARMINWEIVIYILGTKISDLNYAKLFGKLRNYTTIKNLKM